MESPIGQRIRYNNIEYELFAHINHPTHGILWALKDLLSGEIVSVVPWQQCEPIIGREA